jgi:hypothetical protein
MRKPVAFQVDGDMDPFSYGGVFAVVNWRKGDADIMLLRVESIEDCIGSREALEYEFPFWLATAYTQYRDLAQLVADDNVLESKRRMFGADFERPAVGRKHIKQMIQYYLAADDDVAGFESDPDPADGALSRNFLFRGYRGDNLNRDLRRAVKEHTMNRLRSRYGR